MLRARRLRRSERLALSVIAAIVAIGGIVGVIVAIREAEWRLGAASAGILAVAAVYLFAARRGQPL